MNSIKTTANDASVIEFINTVPDETKRADSVVLVELFTNITGQKPQMWGTSIIGFGSYHYKSARSRQEADWPLTGFSPRKQNLTLYITHGFDDYTELLDKLGKHKISKGCLYIKQLADVDMTVLQDLIARTYAATKRAVEQ
jgi:hypothetical protein